MNERIVGSLSRHDRAAAPVRAGDDARRAADRHAVKIEHVVQQLRRRPAGRPVSLKKKAVSHQVPKARDLKYTDDKIDISDLDEILEIDPAARTCTAEPGVTFEGLVEATLRHGLAPIVVPELKTITVGGAVSGGSLESMSFREGGFHDTCLEYDFALHESLRRLADSYVRAGQFDEAEGLLQHAVTLRERALGPGQPGLAVYLGNLAQVHLLRARYDAADALLQRASTLLEKPVVPGEPADYLDLEALV